MTDQERMAEAAAFVDKLGSQISLVIFRGDDGLYGRVFGDKSTATGSSLIMLLVSAITQIEDTFRNAKGLHHADIAADKLAETRQELLEFFYSGHNPLSDPVVVGRPQ